MALTDADFARASKELQCDEAAIRAVAEVESAGKGILPCGIPVILFEAHVFSAKTEHAYDKSHPDISSRKWNRKLYAKGADWIERGRKEAQRLEKASALNRNAALQSASYGRFQVMGYNYELCGFKRVQDFINAMWKNESAQLDAFVAYVKNRKDKHKVPLVKYIQTKDWDSFAAGYNGPGYKINRYDDKIEEAYKKFGGR